MIGQTLHNRYAITARIGKGAMGTVYRATDTQTGREVALKAIARELALDPRMVERFRREGEALRQLRHPNIVEFVDMFQHEGQQVIVMEYVPGGSLHALIKRGPLPVERARRIALELCDALTRAHLLNIVHRDIKPENILMAEDGTPKLTDFGVARLVSEGARLTGTGTQVGTPYYMSPEAWEGKPLDAQADIWSLGVVLFEMLSGQVPFGGNSPASVMTKVLTMPPPDLGDLRDEVPAGLARIVAQMLARDRAARYHTMRAVAADLEKGEPAWPARATPQPAAPTAAAPRREAAAPSRTAGFWRSTAMRLLRFGLGLVGMVAGAGLILAALLILLGAVAASEIVEGALAGAEWGVENSATQYYLPAADLTGGIERASNLYLPGAVTNVETLFTPPDQITIRGQANETPVSLSLSVTLVDERPVLRLLAVNDRAWPVVGNILAGGFNRGLARLLEKSGRQVVGLTVEADQIVVLLSPVQEAAGPTAPAPTETASAFAGLQLNDIQPAWSPDGRWIAFTSFRDGNPEIYLMAADGSQLKRLTSQPGSDVSPAWSPDGERIAFVSDRAGNARLYSMNADGSAVQSLASEAGNYWNPAWSPDGQQIVFGLEVAKRFELWAMELASNARTHLGYGYQPAWSPDGRRLLYVGPFGGYEGKPLYVASPDGSGRAQVADGGNPAWSPDGKWIAFDRFNQGHNDIYVIPADCLANPGRCSSLADRLTDSPADDTDPTWSPDGRWIAFVSDRDGDADIFVMSADGSYPVNITGQ